MTMNRVTLGPSLLLIHPRREIPCVSNIASLQVLVLKLESQFLFACPTSSKWYFQLQLFPPSR